MGTELVSFFIVLFAGLFFSVVLGRIHFPWVIALIASGIVIGPFGLDIFSPGPTLEFLGNVGLIFLMFMVGLEIRFDKLKKIRLEATAISALNGGIPFLVGLGIGWYFGYTLTTALLLGAVFVSSSIAIIIPSLENKRLLNTHVGHIIIVTAMIEDIVSLLLLSILLQTTEAITSLPLPLFYLFLILSVLVLRKILIYAEQFFAKQFIRTRDLFQQQFASVLVLLVGTVIVFDLLGLHPIIGGFFAGVVLSGFITDDVLKGKLRAIGYGIFIPIFFVIIGTKTDIGVFGRLGGELILTLVILLGAMSSKFFTGLLAGKIFHNSYSRGVLIGVTKIPQLSTTLAVTTAGLSLGIFDTTLASALVVLSIVTTFVGPLLTRLALQSRRITKEAGVS